MGLTLLARGIHDRLFIEITEVSKQTVQGPVLVWLVFWRGSVDKSAEHTLCIMSAMIGCHCSMSDMSSVVVSPRFNLVEGHKLSQLNRMVSCIKRGNVHIRRLFTASDNQYINI